MFNLLDILYLFYVILHMWEYYGDILDYIYIYIIRYLGTACIHIQLLFPYVSWSCLDSTDQVSKEKKIASEHSIRKYEPQAFRRLETIMKLTSSSRCHLSNEKNLVV